MVEHDLLRALFDMPAGVHLPTSCLDGAMLLAMGDLVELNAVTFVGDEVVRIAVPPVVGSLCVASFEHTAPGATGKEAASTPFDLRRCGIRARTADMSRAAHE